MATCSICGADVTNLKFCSQCGTAVASHQAEAARAPVVTCSRCGTRVRARAEFCGECGASLRSDVQYRGNNQAQMPPGAPYGSGSKSYLGTPPSYASPYPPQPGIASGGHAASFSTFCPACNLELHPGMTHCPHCHLDLVRASSSGQYHPNIQGRLRQWLFGQHYRPYPPDHSSSSGHHGYRKHRKHDSGDLFDYHKRRKHDSGDLFDDD